MVNNKGIKQKSTTKSKLLHYLMEEKEAVSGEILSTRLNVSRVSIWKAVHGLEKEGFQIESTHKGYRLIPGSAPFYDLEQIDTEYDVFHYPSLESTMKTTKELMEKGNREFLVIADEQTGGIGRKSRKWISEKGGLFMTATFTTSIPLEMYSFLNSCILLKTAEFFQQEYSIPVLMKWPNDLYLEGKKLGGLLIDTRSSGNRITKLEIGTGLNLENRVPDTAISLFGYTDKKICKEHIISSIAGIQKTCIKFLNSGLQKINDILSPLTRFLLTGNVQMEIWPGRNIKGKIKSVDYRGYLIVDTGEEIITISPGETDKTVLIQEL